MYKVKTFKKSKTFVDSNGEKHVILVYGELTKTNHLDGVVVSKVRYVAGDERIIENDKPMFINCGDSYSSVKKFNFGWAICDPRDNFDENLGIELCKKRFGKSPLTTQEGKFLTDDMIDAILENELNFIKNEKLIPILNKKKCETPNIGLKKEVRDALGNRNGNDAVTKYVNKKIEEEIAFKDGDILRIVYKNGRVGYGAFRSVDTKNNTASFYWVVSSSKTEAGVENHYTAPFVYNINGFESVSKACRNDVLEAEKRLEDNFNKRWNWKLKRLEVKDPDKARSIFDLF